MDDQTKIVGEENVQNYRLEFGGKEIDYSSNFEECRKYFPTIQRIVDLAFKRDLLIWWFFEPYVEITWIERNPDDLFLPIAEAELKNLGIKDYRVKTPADGQFAAWYGLTPKEREFSHKRHDACARQAELFMEYGAEIKKGIGEELQYARSAHVLANQLGMNYEAEGMALLKRAMLCFFYSPCNAEQAKERYTKLFKDHWTGG